MLETDNRDLLLDSSDNLVFENGDFQWARGLPGVVQSCRISLSMFKGEWFLDPNVGISYWQEILGKKPEQAVAAITSEFYQALMRIEDVVSVTKLTVVYNPRTRTCIVNWAVRCQFGVTSTQTITI